MKKYRRGFVFAVCLCLLVVLTGCVETKPVVEDVELSSSILPAQSDRTLDLAYSVNNKLSFAFQGNIELVYDDKCLVVNPNEREISLEAAQKVPYSSTIQPNMRYNRDIDEKCFDVHELTIVLYDQNKQSVLSRKTVSLTLTKT